MWITRDEYTELREKRAGLEAENKALTQQVATLNAMFDSLTMRLRMAEHERAQLLYNYTGVKIATPAVERQSQAPSQVADILHRTPSFDDVGDTEAARLGIGWNTQGELSPVGR